MPGTNIFEYAVIRVVPRVDREEFLNVGVVLFCPSLKFLDLRIDHDCRRLLSLDPRLDLDELERHLHAFGSIIRGEPAAGPIGRLDLAGRFRWLTATRSTVLQTSKVHPGLCTDPAATLAKLFTDLVAIE
ncbi:MAG TPA: DUF3037 domain-containing protein [Puia sp.]|nr:DUF3037 domain-containing protein [Puia sp.]